MKLQLTADQYEMLLQQLPDYRVRQLRGQSHLEAWDVRRTLTRIFGFGGFDVVTKDLTLVSQIEHVPGSIKRSNGSTNDRTAWSVVYRAEVRLVIKNPDGSVGAIFEDGASGDSQNQPSLGDAHDQAMKTALSQGLKRCAVNLGDQFGLSLYNNGRTDRVVIKTLVGPAGEGADREQLPTNEAPVQGEPEAPAVADEQPAAVAESEQPRAAEPPALSPAAANLIGAITVSWGREALTASWNQLREAEAAGHISAEEGTYLKEVWTRQKDRRPASDQAVRRLHALFNEAEITDRDAKLRYIAEVIGQPVSSSKALDGRQVQEVSARLDQYIKQSTPPSGVAA